MNLRAPGVLARLLAFVAASALPLAAHSQVVTGSFAPPQVGSNTASTLTLSYAGFTSDSVGMVLRVYYDSAKVTPGSVSYNNPPGSSQPANAPAAGTLAGCTGANTFIALNWVDFGAGWPNPTAGQLATVPFTSANPFTSNALVCWVDDTSGGTPVRNITGNATLNAPPPTITIAAAPGTLTDSAGQISTVTVASNFAPASNLVVNLTNSMPPGRATTACGSTITILATQTTASCTVTATPNTVPFDGNVNASVTVAGGTGYAVGAPSTANVAINDNDLPTVSIGASPNPINDSAGSASIVTVTLNAVTPAIFPVNLTLPAVNPRYSTNCVNPLPVPAGSGTATCTVAATANAVVGDGNATASVGIAPSGTYIITGTNPVDVTIQDDDIPVISAVCAPLTLTDSAGQTSTCTISSDMALAAPLTVNLNLPAVNARYTTTCVATIVVPIGGAGTSNTCTISAVANTTIGDGNVTASLSVAAGTGYNVGGTPQNVAINNDDLASISVSVSPTPVAEDSGTPMVYTFTASGASTGATSILFTPPAASGRYSTTCVSPIVLLATDTVVTCSVTPIDNTVLDGPATATVTVLPNAGVYTVGAPSVATGTITDNEVTASVSATNASETGPANGVVTFTRDGPTTSTLNLNSAIAGTATYATDYTLTAGTCVIVTQNGSSITVTVPLGSSSCTINVVPVNDTGVETGGETVTFAPPTGINVTPTGSTATVTIADNDGLPSVGVTAAGSCAEALVPVNCTFTVTATTNTSPAQTGNGPLVPFALTGSATNDTDYKLVSGANCANAAFTGPIQTVFGTPTTLTLCVIDDLTIESGGETVVLTLTANGSSYALSPASAPQTIADDDSPQVVSVVASLPAIPEAGGSTTFVFTRTGGSVAAQQAAVTANVTLGGTATFGTSCAAGVDFTLAVVAPATASLTSPPRTITFPASVSTAAVTITACDDLLVDPSETAALTVAPPTVATDYTVATPPANTATVTITDNDALPSVGVTAAGSCAEALVPVNCTFTVTATTNTSPPQTGNGPLVPFTLTGSATNNTDYKLVNGANCADAAYTGPIQTVFGTPTTLTVCVIDDLLVESGGETVVLTLTANASTYALSPASASQTIADDDSPQVVSVAATAPAITEAGGSTTFVFTRTGGSVAAQQAAVTANVTLGGTATSGTSCAAGVDFTLAVVAPATASLDSAPRTVTFPASASTAAVTITACDDLLVDPSETATLTVAPPTVATDYTVATPPANTATVTITDNEIGVGVVATASTITEGGNAVFTISCQGVATFAVNYSFSGSYVPLPASGSDTLTCGTPLPVTVPATDDTDANGDRTLILTITSVGEPGVVNPASASATVVVQDNEVVVIRTVQTIPTMNTLGLMLLGLLLTAAAAFGMRRRS